MDRRELESGAFRVLSGAWQADVSYCVPNSEHYPHLWLWDSCFHSMAWAAVRDQRAAVELQAVFRTQFENGFVPHMTYGKDEGVWRGPRPDVSCFTQPPVYALALARVEDNGLSFDPSLVLGVSRALQYFSDCRMVDGLAKVVHPWETGCDDSPRWDSWVGSSSWNRAGWTAFDERLAASAGWGAEGDAHENADFESVSSLFNGILAHALTLHGERHDDQHLTRAGARLAESIELSLWDDDQGLYVDRAIVGGGPSVSVPTLDGILATLGTASPERAAVALEQLGDPDRFAGPQGLRYVAADHPTYEAGTYWRGAAWPQLTLLAVEACRRWGFHELAGTIADQARRTIPGSGWSGYWNPDTGEGLGAKPQTWAALAAAL
ncbi:MGH1-like glycoside hydrolase domain-containing protein [Modestobacter excelsi]|uniref:MGH1-like glycoside hydrolase domain-containing protein n=1 Tax=Modestobacter excelsi TaxID=2213161 RepID=UPI00110CA69E|nr:hypothetical protein [Modestobacter excelsi]